jgi:hypothetical protein
MTTDSSVSGARFPSADVLAADREADCRRIHGRLSRLAKQRAALDAQEARDLVAGEELGIWTVFGYTTMLAYLEGELGYGPHVAGERLRVAHALESLPLTAERLAAGELHHSAVRELTRVATADTEAAWLAAADGKNLRQIERLVAGHRPGDVPDDDPDPDLELRAVTIQMSPATYALYRQARRHLDAQTGERLSEDAAMALTFRAVLEPGSEPSERPAAQVAFTICTRCARGTQDGAGIEADVDAATVERALCDAEILGDVTADAPARVTTTVTPRIRRQVLARDHHRCVVPGCRNTRYLDIHHLRFQSLGGKHQTSNLACLCAAHHDMLHRSQLVILGQAPDLQFYRRTDEGALTELTDSVPRGRDLYSTNEVPDDNPMGD